jgi:hypothetical protein
MNRNFILAIILAVFSYGVSAQQFMTRSADISFLSTTPIENIEAINSQVSALLDASSGAIAFSVPIRGFRFERALMEEHFNENYMETEMFPTATLKGNISNWKEVRGLIVSDGEDHEVEVVGVLNIHGVEINPTFTGIISFRKNNWALNSEFEVNAIDFGIKIPSLVRKQIADSIIVTVNASLSPR